jgi:predicted S18 family serine protease
LRAIPNSIKKLEDKCNEILVNMWKEEFASGEVKSKSEFIRKYQRNIFTVKQLKDLCQLLGSAERYADEIKYKSNIETYTELDLKELIELIVEGLDTFTANDS